MGEPGLGAALQSCVSTQAKRRPTTGRLPETVRERPTLIQPPRHLPAGQTGGIALFCISVLLLCCMDVLIKLSSEGIPVFEILFFRSGVALLVTLAVALARRGRQVLTANRPGLLLLRGTSAGGLLCLLQEHGGIATQHQEQNHHRDSAEAAAHCQPACRASR